MRTGQVEDWEYGYDIYKERERARERESEKEVVVGYKLDNPTRPDGTSPRSYSIVTHCENISFPIQDTQPGLFQITPSNTVMSIHC